MEKPWINFKKEKPSVNKDILLIWICDRDGCMGTVKCSVMSDGTLWISPGNFFVDGHNGEEAMYWMVIPDYPEDIQDFINYHYGHPDQDPNSHFDNEHLEDDDLPF